MKFADVIVDISVEELDRTFQYIIPKQLEAQIGVGDKVAVPFGSTKRTGYVIGISDTPAIAMDKLKELIGVVEDSIAADGRFIRLAYWMKTQYGSTMNQALKTVLPVKRAIKRTLSRSVRLLISSMEAESIANEIKRRSPAQARVLMTLAGHKNMDYSELLNQCNAAASTIKALNDKGLIEVNAAENIRNELNAMPDFREKCRLNEEQAGIADRIIKDWDNGDNRTCLIRGVTGSGKTEVYMEIIQHVIESGREVIVLIPEIALTHQTVMRFCNRFGDLVSVIHSRLSLGEKYDRFELARQGRIKIMIGPRTALFTPFDNLGLIIIDEEHENAYQSDTTPKYHARETAIQIAGMCNAKVILGSATPSLEAYYRAEQGIYNLYELNNRAGSAGFPNVRVVDLREELRMGNRSIISNTLMNLMEDRLAKKEQIMLFLNRRGYNGFVSCRSCGAVVECPHCAVSLTLHKNNRLICHYCGYETVFNKKCSVCGSKHIGTFSAGTQLVEEQVSRLFPDAGILRMDADTTKGKRSHEEILQSFLEHKADILIGTQMIVKGHDFPNVTLVGVLVADTSLYAADYTAAERTFDLLTQAAGRAGRKDKPGDVVIQAYDTEHYAIKAACNNDYDSFYQEELAFRELMDYPPAMRMMSVTVSSSDEKRAVEASDYIKELTHINEVKVIGPANASIYRINDVFYRIIYYKAKENKHLTQIKDIIESALSGDIFKGCQVQFDFR